MQTAIATIFLELLLSFGCIYAAINLHNGILARILHAPLLYFDQTPIGRILQRFSKDIEVVDQKIPGILTDLLYCAAEVISYN